MNPGLRPLTLAASVALLALAAACGRTQSGGTPTTLPTALLTAVPSATAPSPLPVLPTVSPKGRVTFYGTEASDNAAAIAAGDFNGDTIPDIVLAAVNGDGPANARPDAGEAYVFLGPFTPGQARDPAADQRDLVIYGAHTDDHLGRALTAGDFNGDGVDDIALGAPFADGPDLARPDSGQVYLLFGSSRWGKQVREVDLAAGDQDATVFGADADDLAGSALHAADVNGDHSDDLIIGAFWADGPDNGRPNAGEVNVIYGGSDRRRVDLALGQQDEIVYGAEAGDLLGDEVETADVNGDGCADLILAATFASGPGNSRDRAGETYLFLCPHAPVLDTARGEQDVTILGADPGDQIGHSIGAGDLNKDGFDDLLLGALSADGPENQSDLAGEAYLILGGEHLADVIDTAADGADALIYGAAAVDRLGRSVTMGDVNGDGFSDAVLSAPNADGRAGAVYVVYGRPKGPYPGNAGQADITVQGLDAEDILGHEAFGRPPLATADMDGDGLADLLVTASSADGPGNERPDAGEAYIIYMK